MSGYFDAATAEPLDPVARQALDAALDDGWADPQRAYREGRRARILLDEARAAVATVLVTRADQLVPQEALGTQFLDIRTLIGTADVPLHPGAAQAYRQLHG